MIFKQKRKHLRLDDIETNINKILINPKLPEKNDIPEDRFGMPHRYYRNYEPNFRKTEKQGLKAYLSLCKIFGYQPKNVSLSP
ncbi:MAG: hypothetical protein WCX73_02380 [Candidatus Pacearchaeota archaeon]|jgi:hypothetical protein